jgi:DNA-directed RNA polymerase specialized sigma24 family protein
MNTVTRALVPISSERALVAAVRAHASRIKADAREIARGNRDFADDLEQEAMIRLWELDPTRFDPASDDDQRFLHRALVNHMQNVALSSRRPHLG